MLVKSAILKENQLVNNVPYLLAKHQSKCQKLFIEETALVGYIVVKVQMYL